MRQYTDRLVRSIGVEDGVPFVVVCDNKTGDTVDALVESALSHASNVDLRVFNLDEIGRPIKKMPEELDQTLEEITHYRGGNPILFTCTGTSPQGIHTAEKDVWKQFRDLDEKRHIKRIGLGNPTREMFKTAYHDMNHPDFPLELLHVLKYFDRVKVTCPLGTSLNIHFDHQKHPFLISGEHALPGVFTNAIPAEDYTFPKFIEGVYVISEHSALRRMRRYQGDKAKRMVTDLKRTPVFYTILGDEKGGYIKYISCKDKVIERFLYKEILKKRGNAKRICEVAFPANLAMMEMELTGVFLIDEKGRFHLGNGNPYKANKPLYTTKHAHGDATCDNVTIIGFRGPLYCRLMTNGRYNPELFKCLREEGNNYHMF